MKALTDVTLLLFVLLATAASPVVDEDEDDDDEKAVIDALEECRKKIKPPEEALEEIADGELKSDAAKAVITCGFKKLQLLKDDGSLQLDETLAFMRVFTPGHIRQDSAPIFRKAAENCATTGADQPKASDTEAAVRIYHCLVRESLRMLSEAERRSNFTARLVAG